jgi:hypothetical protein
MVIEKQDFSIVDTHGLAIAVPPHAFFFRTHRIFVHVEIKCFQ